MNENYLIYPCKTMRITQTYLGKASHKPHTDGSPADYPIDEGCSGSGRDWFYCPCDEMVVRRIYGVGNSGVNTLWLQSTDTVSVADGSKVFVTMCITHPNDGDLKKLKVGQRFVRGDKVCREGSDGGVGNHLHISAGTGLFKGNGWTKNSNGKWVLTVTGKALPPEQLFYIDKNFTCVQNDGGLKFKILPEKKVYATGNYTVTGADLLHVRRGPGTQYEKKSYSELTYNAKIRIRDLTGEKKDGYVKGLSFTVYEVQDNWGRTPSGWVCLDYCEAIK